MSSSQSSVLLHLLLICLSAHTLLCAERERAAAARERFKVVIAPRICRRVCVKGQCRDTCEQGSNTTLIAENGQGADTLIGQGFTVVVCPLTCMNGGVCSSRKHCLCPPGFTGRLCQFPLHQMHQAQAARGNKQPVYPEHLKPDGLKIVEQTSIARTQLTQTRSVFTLPFSAVGHHSSEVQFNFHVHHTPDTSVVIQPLDTSQIKAPLKPGQRAVLTRHKPKGRCFQETTPKQACNSTPLPVLTNQEDCCGSVGNSWGQNKCYQCPKLPNASVKQTIVEDYGSTCPQGYKRYNSTHCQDINECTLQGVCQNGDCLNTLGGFNCSCKSGFVLERNRCVESAQCFRIVSESRGCEHPLPTHLTQEVCCCTVGKAWGHHCERCPQVGTVAFSKICPAGKGYFLQKFSKTLSFPSLSFPRMPDNEGESLPLFTTPDTDECRVRNICGHGECENSLNGHVCHCHPGYHLNPQRNTCEDDNECQSEPCGHGRGLCVNIDGGYKCVCRPGYKHMVQHGRLKCIDVNECSKPEICGVGGQCVNLPGSYKCECLDGFRSRSQRQQACEDINECLDPNTCPNEQCENTAGSYECVPCLRGHEAVSGICYDMNECQKPGVCPNGRCENLPGTYRCLCNEGFIPSVDSKGCSDIDECEDVRLCAYGRCINTDGSFKCQCYPGYQRTQEGSHCEDVDECASDRSLCQPFGFCENRPGSYVCDCNHGYVLSEDKHSCEATPKHPRIIIKNQSNYIVLATNVTKQECCCSIGVGWGDHCEIYPCPVSQSAEFHYLCPNGLGLYYEEGFQYSLPAYHDIDECSLFAEEICKKGRCENTLPGYECYCQQGFYYDSNLLECIDVNECQDPSYCKNGRCENTPGSFHCFCDPPLTFSAALKQCVYDGAYHIFFVHITVNHVCRDQSIQFDHKNSCHPKKKSVTAKGENEYDPSCCKHCKYITGVKMTSLLSPLGPDRTAAHRDVCFLQVDEGLICSRPRNGFRVTYSECCCHYGRGWGPECNTCPPRNSEMFSRLCEMHLETESDGEHEFQAAFAHYNPGDSSEEDSDECSCANGRCVRSYLGTMCECNAGFRLDHSRIRCIDIDECAEAGVRVNPCKNARCVNTSGSFKCSCKHGFVATRRPNVCARRRSR
uniref:Latent transforming growth factor beta binding protein 3 n=1 Tax=Gouania willdenowi TaxID=441366 RepID=A0A8C5EST5_GOUWI